MAETIFIGGPRHAGPVPADALSQKTYIDVATATRYDRREMTMVQPHPLTGKPWRRWTHSVFVAEGQAEQQVNANLFDALLRRFLFAQGTMHDIHQTPNGNGKETSDHVSSQDQGNVP